MSNASTVQDNQNGNGQKRDTEARRGINFFDDSTPLSDQIGGDHYRDLPIQPFVVNYHNLGPGAALGEMYNRMMSFFKTGDLEELVKLGHENQMLIYMVTEDRRCKEAGSSCLSGVCAGGSRNATD